jgi:hypothetical protein
VSLVCHASILSLRGNGDDLPAELQLAADGIDPDQVAFLEFAAEWRA